MAVAMEIAIAVAIDLTKLVLSHLTVIESPLLVTTWNNTKDALNIKGKLFTMMYYVLIL